MKREYFLISLFLLIVAIFFYLFYRMMAPLFIPIAWGAILAIVFYPLYKRVNRKVKSPGWAALLICIFVFFVIIGPALYLLANLVGEASDAFNRVNTLYESGELSNYLARVTPFFDKIRLKLYAAYPDLAKINFESTIKDIITTVTTVIGAKATTVVANITKTIFQFFLTIFAMYYFFRDGNKVVSFLKRMTPLNSDQVGITYIYLKEVVEGTMYGGVVMAIIQGSLGGILFAIMGISSPVFWGAVMGFLSFLPILGPFLIYIPAGLILILAGSPVKGILTLFIGTVVISQVDNFVRPLLFRGKTQMHTFLMFFSIMGGMAMFGLIGIVLGPLVTAIFLTILKIFEFKLHPESGPIDYTS